MLKANDKKSLDENKEKVCSFYASDYHFEMISLPYIQKELKNKNEVIIFTENNLKDTMDKVLERINIKDEEKQKIKDIDWSQEIQEKLAKMKALDNQNKTVFIKGSKKYINDIEEQIETVDSNATMIHCYPIQEVAQEVNDIVKEYDLILNTVGIKVEK